jgi:hypothetical protein
MFGVPNTDGYLGVQPDEILNMPPHHITWWAESVFWYVASQFGLEVVAIEAERLNNRDTYFDIVALRVLMRCLKVRRRFLFDGPRYVATKWVAKRIRKLVAVALRDVQLLPVGHTLLAVLRKV